MSQDVQSEYIQIYTILDLISDFGGFFQAVVVTFFWVLGSEINKHYIMGKFIRALYYTHNDQFKSIRSRNNKNSESLESTLKGMQPIKFTQI